MEQDSEEKSAGDGSGKAGSKCLVTQPLASSLSIVYVPLSERRRSRLIG